MTFYFVTLSQFVGDMENVVDAEVDAVYGKTIMHPSFMAGHVFSQSMMDTLLSQNYFKYARGRN